MRWLILAIVIAIIFTPLAVMIWEIIEGLYDEYKNKNKTKHN